MIHLTLQTVKRYGEDTNNFKHFHVNDFYLNSQEKRELWYKITLSLLILFYAN